MKQISGNCFDAGLHKFCRDSSRRVAGCVTSTTAPREGVIRTFWFQTPGGNDHNKIEQQCKNFEREDAITPSNGFQ